MTPTRQGSFRLFRLAGVDVFLHWSWFVLVLIEINLRRGEYSSLVWNALEYLSLFLIVLLHEFGHSLACRSVGGQANQIVLWPLGGVAYVAPPQRPGAMLWSIAAGPLVNVVLVPVLFGLNLLSQSSGWEATLPNADRFLRAMQFTNLVLLIFNLLPIYPLDGGQILRSLLWFVVGRAKSLLVASIIGLVGVAALIGLAIFTRSVWFGVIAAFILLNCWSGLRQARMLIRMEKLPRRPGYACPACRVAPSMGEFWVCGRCRKPFDTFVTHAACPHCSAQFGVTQCLNCSEVRPISEWMSPAAGPANS